MRRAWTADRLAGRAPRWTGEVVPDTIHLTPMLRDDPAVPRRRLAVVCCSDCRLDPLAALGLDVGDAHVFRNAGGRVTREVLRGLERSQRRFGTVGVAVITHTDCRNLVIFDEPRASALDGLETVRAAGLPHPGGAGAGVVDLASGRLVRIVPWTAGGVPAKDPVPPGFILPPPRLP